MIYSIGTTGYIRSLRDLKKILDELSRGDDDVSIEFLGKKGGYKESADFYIGKNGEIKIKLI